MPEALHMHWLDGQSVLNLRGHPDDVAFLRAVQGVLGVELPLEPCRTTEAAGLRIVWAGPDDWFLIGAAGRAELPIGRLREALAGVHAAVTDVGSGYTVLRLMGDAAAAVLAQGCPLDLHPRAFGPDRAAGSHFFKASVWVWRAGGGAGFELLVRRSFRSYVQLMLERAVRACGAALSGSAPSGPA